MASISTGCFSLIVFDFSDQNQSINSPGCAFQNTSPAPICPTLSPPLPPSSATIISYLEAS